MSSNLVARCQDFLEIPLSPSITPSLDRFKDASTFAVITSVILAVSHRHHAFVGFFVYDGTYL